MTKKIILLQYLSDTVGPYIINHDTSSHRATGLSKASPLTEGATTMRRLSISCLFGACLAFRFTENQRRPLFVGFPPLRLIPVRRCAEDFGLLSNSDGYRGCLDRFGNFGEYELCVVEVSDLPDVARFVVQTFGADATRLSRDLSSFERMLVTPAIELVNGYSGIVAFAEVLAGLRSRLGFRLKCDRMDLSRPNLDGLSRDDQIRMAACSSVILALGKNQTGDNSNWRIDVIASVELRLQPCDAKIPFSLPWIDHIERRLASIAGLDKKRVRDLQPYLSNLCVDESQRGKGIGRSLVRYVERIAESRWGYSRMYLHVDTDNTAALKLYESEGYRDVGRRWNPFWAGKSAAIGYFVKNMNEGGARVYKGNE